VHKLSLSLASVFIYVALASTSVVQAEKEINTYGPINEGDILWNIANKVAPTSVSRYKVILALQRANPHAFRFPCNMASLKINEILRIPSLLEMQKINVQEAIKEVNRQQEEWNNRHDKPIVCPPVAQKPAIASTTETSTDNTSKLVAKIPSRDIPPTSDTLKPSTIKADKLNSKTAESVDKTQHVTLVSDEETDHANKAADKDTPIFNKNFFQIVSSTMIISLIAIGGLFLIILVAGLLHKYAKDKTNENDIPEEYNFHEPIDEMPYYNEKQFVSNEKLITN
jgi:FimV-like protein